MAIGQGPLWVTPMQAAQLVASVATGGEMWQPYIVEKIVSPSNELLYRAKPKKKHKVVATDEAWQLLHRALEMVVTDGTGHAVYFPDLEVAAKTGTAQNPQGQDHAWMVCYAPAQNPELAVAVLVENGGHGGVVAGPVARSVLQTYFKLSKDATPATVDDARE
jgi:cell division protein FtsI/penicillin-binding protein 2